MTVFDHQTISEEKVFGALAAHMGMLVLSPDGIIVGSNETYRGFTGYDPDELAGRSYRSLCQVEFLTSHGYVEFWEKLRRGDPVSGRFCRQKRDGGDCWLDSKYFPVMNDDGELACVALFCSDCGDRVHEEIEEADTLATLDRAMLTAEYTPSGSILKANENFLSALSLGAAEAIGRDIQDLFAETDGPRDRFGEIWECVSSGHTYSGRVEMRGAGGEAVWLEAVHAPVFGEGGKLYKIAVLAIDVTWRIQGEIDRQGKMGDVSLLLEQAGTPMIVSDRGNKVIFANAAFTRMFGYAAEDMPGKSPTCVFGPQEHKILAEYRSALKSGRTLYREEMVYGKNGQRLYASLAAAPVFAECGGHKYTVSSFMDITFTKMREILQYRTLSALSHDVTFREALNHICLETEKIFPEIAVVVTGIDKGGGTYVIAAPSVPKACVDDLNATPHYSASATALRRGEYSVCRRASGDDGAEAVDRCVLRNLGIGACSAAPIYSAEGKALGTVAFCHLDGGEPRPFHRRVADVATRLCALAFEQERKRDAIRQMTFYDPVTSLPNRNLLVRRAEQSILANQFSKNCDEAAVMCLNIDRFKRINDSLGFGAGNLLLDAVGKRLAERLKPETLVGRLNGDVFAAILPGCTEEKAAVMAERLQKAVSAPCDVLGTEVLPTVSIGISMYPENGDDAQTLLDKADTAVSLARKNRHRSFAFFSEQYNSAARTNMSLESCLHRAVQDGGLSLHYQPQVGFADRSLHGAEALARWSHPDFGMVAPSTFIPLAEESGIIEELSDWVVREAARQVREWRDGGLDVGRVSLNLSALNFHDAGLPERLNRHLSDRALSPADIAVELTEGVLLDDNPATMATIRHLHDLGFSLALDDFGTGYSSLGYLRKLPVDTIKLDRSFILDIITDAASRKLSESILHLCRNLGFTVVVEGVEGEDQFELLKSQGYDVVQGYFISKPLPAAEFREWVAARSNELTRPAASRML